jgi:splicing factor 3A subunit 3
MSRAVEKVSRQEKKEERRSGAGEGEDERGEFVDFANSVKSVGDLMKYSGEWLKTQLALRNLKVGGSLEQKAKRLFDAKDSPRPVGLLGGGAVATVGAGDDAPGVASITSTSSLFPIIDVVKGLKGISDPTMSQPHQIDLLQTVLLQLYEILHSTVQNTCKRIEKFATLTPSEIAAAREVEKREIETEEEGGKTVKGDGEEEEEEEEAIYNPLNLPLDWDGKPIPYWLWKLQGLNISYNCEICGNTSFQGRKNFDKHFHEAKHTRGLRLLGIANTKQFQDITRIDDALELAKVVVGSAAR